MFGRPRSRHADEAIMGLGAITKDTHDDTDGMVQHTRETDVDA